MRLQPTSRVAPAELDAGKRALVLDAAFASLTGALSGGVILCERRVVQAFGLEALCTVNLLSSVVGTIGTLFSPGHLLERPLRLRTLRRWRRRATDRTE